MTSEFKLECNAANYAEQNLRELKAKAAVEEAKLGVLESSQKMDSFTSIRAVTKLYMAEDEYQAQLAAGTKLAELCECNRVIFLSTMIVPERYINKWKCLCGDEKYKAGQQPTRTMCLPTE